MADRVRADGIMRLAALGIGRQARVTGLSEGTPDPVARRLFDLGFRSGATVDCVRRAPMGSPTIYYVGDSDICLRPAEARHVTVEVVP